MSVVEYAVRLAAGQLGPTGALTLSPPEKEQVLVLFALVVVILP
ncbi:hypothetical protein [Roseibium sp. M-1]